MGAPGFQFDASQPYQLEAIASVVDLFDGQPQDAEQLVTALHTSPDVDEAWQATFDLASDVGAVGNRLVLHRDLILANLQRVQDGNGLEVSGALHDNALDFDIEMETGTGKTYVYLRTIFELAVRYRFTKFVILVPSVAIREGVSTSIRLMRQHFEDLYKPLGVTFDDAVYSGKSPDEVRPFATATNVQIMVMTIDSIRGAANTRVFHRDRNQLGGLTPRDFIRATNPIVVMDEPQNMESGLSQEAIAELEPAFTLRYSATHGMQRNVVYRLDPVDAHEKGLVKQIVVADVRQQGADATPYIKLVEVRRDPWVARLELSVRRADGSSTRAVRSVPRDRELSDSRITGNPDYEGWRVTDLYAEPGSVDLTRHGLLREGESIGASADAIAKEMIRETIREHLRKEDQLRDRGIKVLSLFFVDKVASYLGSGTNNHDANGDFARWFDEVFVEERSRHSRYQELLPQDPIELRRAYFSEIKRGGAKVLQDSKGTTKADDDAYELIMRDKERLLDESVAVRFLFSHSALREGWDNPNVFQICSLREMSGATERRQTLGRGLRLPVAKTGDGYVRTADLGLATLTVIANESYKTFAEELQKEYRAAGVEIGRVRRAEFARIDWHDEQGAITDEQFGYQRSVQVWEHLRDKGFIESTGEVTARFRPNELGFTLDLPVDFAWAEMLIVELVGKANMGTYLKQVSKRQPRVLNKELYLTQEFEEFWEAISRRSTYRVHVDRDELIEKTIAAIRSAPTIEPLRIQVTRAGIRVLRGGARGEERGTRSAELRGGYPLPDIITELQQATSLTRRTIVDILTGCDRLGQFIGNPNDFLAMAKRVLQRELSNLLVKGIQYERIAGSVYELRELQKDGEQEKDRFLDQLYHVQNLQKTDFDHVVLDSEVERRFAALLDSREDVRLFMKLPAKFKIDTPVGPYNPDWAIVKHEGGEDRVYMIRETKSTLDDALLRPMELAKIRSAEQHFAAIGVPNFGRSAPGGWNL